MVSKTNEQALEASIEKFLTGTCLEKLAAIRDSAGDKVEVIDIDRSAKRIREVHACAVGAPAQSVRNGEASVHLFP